MILNQCNCQRVMLSLQKIKSASLYLWSNKAIVNSMVTQSVRDSERSTMCKRVQCSKISEYLLIKRKKRKTVFFNYKIAMIPFFIITRVDYDWIKLIKLMFATIKLHG